MSQWPDLSVEAVVEVDDTGIGIDEGREAGCWTVGVTLSGNEAGVTADEFAALSEAGRNRLRKKAAVALGRHRPHYVIDTVADLLPVIEEIEGRMSNGERP